MKLELWLIVVAASLIGVAPANGGIIKGVMSVTGAEMS
jgi:hypothetical protein